MKNKAFTMAEALIALALVAVLAALSVVAISNSKPDESIIKFRRAYATTVKIVNELLNDEEVYPHAKEPDASMPNIISAENIKGLKDATITDEMKTKYPNLNGSNATNKFANLFITKSNAFSISSPAGNQKRFTTPDGIQWTIAAYDPTSSKIIANIYVYPFGNTNDFCFYNATTCPIPTKFSFVLYNTGKIITAIQGNQNNLDPMACSYLRYPKINKAKKIPTINNSCFDNGGGGSSSSSSGGSGSTSSSGSGSTTSSGSGSTTSSGSGSTTSSGSGSTTSSGSGSTSSSGSGSTSSSGSGSTTSSGSGSTTSSGSGSTSSSGSGSTSSGGSGGGMAAAAAGASGGTFQGSQLLISIDTFLVNSYQDKTGTKVLTSFYTKHPEFKDFDLVEPMRLFNDRVITYFIALHPEMRDTGLTIDTNTFISSPKFADFKALAEIYFPAFVFAHYRPEFRTNEIDGYSYSREKVQQKIDSGLVKTMQQVQAAGGISRVPSAGELKQWLIDKLLQGLW